MKEKQNSFHKPINTTRWLRLLSYFCPAHLYESIEGDLLEQFEIDLKTSGYSKAKRRFVWSTIRFLRPGILLRNTCNIKLNQTAMFQNYLKVMLRNAMKRKAYAAITLFGLTAGLTFSMLVGVFVWQELNVNHQLKDVERLYILEQQQGETSGINFFAPADLVKVMRDDYPAAIENYYRFWDRSVKVSKDDKHFIIQSIVGDSTLFKMFGFPVVYGDVNLALSQPYNVAITEKVALQFFNRTDVIGESLLLSSGTAEKKEYIITAVLPALKKNSVSDIVNIDAQIFLSLQNVPDFRLPDPNGWTTNMVSYLKVADGVTTQEAMEILRKTITRHAPNSVKDNLKISLAGLADYYLVTNNGASKKMVITLSGIAGFILVLALINFVNISIGSAAVRLKEIGVRKVIGGVRTQLIFQFLTESLLLTFAAGTLSILLYELLRPTFEDLFSTSLTPVFKLGITFWIRSCLLLLSVGLAAGTYPAFFMSGYSVGDSFRGKLKSIAGSIQVPKMLVTFQFLIAICVFISAIVVTEQVGYFLKKDLGYDKSFVLTISSVPRIWTEAGVNQMNVAKQQLMQSPRVESVSLSWEVPNGNAGGDASLYKDGSELESALSMPLLKTDDDYHVVYGLKVLDGRFFFSEGESWIPNTLVINKKASEALAVKVGDRVRMTGVDSVFTIRGILDDFHFTSLRDPLKPLAIMHMRDINAYRFFSIRLRPGNVAEAVAEVETRWKAIFPDDPFNYAFMDEMLASLYKTEVQLKKATVVATALMLIIILTGIIGVVSLSVAKRSKEIGIRKVLGASVSSILTMFSKEYVALCIISFALAVPLAYFLIGAWLNGFPYRVDMEWWMFAGPGILTITVTLALVVLQSLKTATDNPTITLKYE